MHGSLNNQGLFVILTCVRVILQNVQFIVLQVSSYYFDIERPKSLYHKGTDQTVTGSQVLARSKSQIETPQLVAAW